MTIQPTPGTDHSSLDDAQSDAEDQATPDQTPDDPKDASVAGGQVSEAGGASLNAETSAGGADAVPDTHG